MTDENPDDTLSEEIQEGEAIKTTEKPKAEKPKAEKPKPTTGGFVKGTPPQESTYNGVELWTANYDQWFEILSTLGKNSQICTGTTKADFCVDGVRLWSSLWEDKLAMLEKLVK